MMTPYSNGKLMAASGATLRRAREQGELVQVGPDLVVRMRPVELDVLLEAGEIPDLLTPMVIDVFWGRGDKRKVDESPELTKEYIQLVNIITKAALLSPRIVDNPTADDEIQLGDLDFRYRQNIYRIAISGVDALKSFRYEQTLYVEPVSGQQDSGDTAKQENTKQVAETGVVGLSI